jgi:hypothetical protein
MFYLKRLCPVFLILLVSFLGGHLLSIVNDEPAKGVSFDLYHLIRIVAMAVGFSWMINGCALNICVVSGQGLTDVKVDDCLSDQFLYVDLLRVIRRRKSHCRRDCHQGQGKQEREYAA